LAPPHGAPLLVVALVAVLPARSLPPPMTAKRQQAIPKRATLRLAQE